MNPLKRVFTWLLAIPAALLLFPIPALADTNGSEIQITDRPDQFILQLGSQWAGVEFELKTDAGVFPIPVIVDHTGVLRMDLGGSRTYTLSCLTSPVSVPIPEQPDETPLPAYPPVPSAEPGEAEPIPADSEPTASGVPAGHLILFLLGTAVAVGVLIAMKFLKRRREGSAYYDDEYDYE